MSSAPAAPRCAPSFIDPPGYARHRPEETLLYQGRNRGDDQRARRNAGAMTVHEFSHPRCERLRLRLDRLMLKMPAHVFGEPEH